MSTVNIPVQNRVEANILSIALTGVVFTFFFKYNRNEGKWYFDVKKEDVNIISGVKLVSSEDILSQFKAYDVPSGKVSIFDKDGLYNDPDDSNFGESVFLRYID